MIDLPALAAVGDEAAFATLATGDQLDRRALAAALLIHSGEVAKPEADRLQATALHLLDALADEGCEEAGITLMLAGRICSPDAWALAVGV